MLKTFVSFCKGCDRPAWSPYCGFVVANNVLGAFNLYFRSNEHVFE